MLVNLLRDILYTIIAAIHAGVQFLLPDKRWKCRADLTGQTVVITGGNCGIGLATVEILSSKGARVVIGCRDTAKAKDSIEHLVANNGAEIVVHFLDLSALDNVRKFADIVLQQEKRIDILINNAGVFHCPESRTEDGFEMHFGVNHLGHFLLTNLLLPRLKESAPARIITVSSMLHFFGRIHFKDINLSRNYSPNTGYNQSKVANVLFSKYLAEILKGTGVTTYCLHPGVIATELWRHVGDVYGIAMKKIFDTFGPIFMKKPKNGAQTTLYCATKKSLSNETGCYYSGCRRLPSSPFANNMGAAKKLWELSEELTGLRDSNFASVRDMKNQVPS